MSITLRDFAAHDSKLYLKSEYGPLSTDWPVVAFTATALKNKLEREYRTGRDFIIYTGTSGSQTADERDRGRLLSVVDINTTRTYRTADVIPSKSWEWATTHYPGQWQNAFEAIRGWDIPSRPWSSEVMGDAYSKMGKYPYRGMVLELEGDSRDAVLALEIAPVEGLGFGQSDGTIDVPTLLRPENRLINQEATRLADLVFSRVQLSGQIVQSTAPIRNAPTALLLQIANLLRQTPLTCALCGGELPLKPENKLLQPSGDRMDSDRGDYGPDNYQLVHLACNLGKNSATSEQFQEWLNVVRKAVDS